MKFGLISNSELVKLLLTLEIALLPSFSPQSYLEFRGNRCHLQKGRVTVKIHGSH